MGYLTDIKKTNNYAGAKRGTSNYSTFNTAGYYGGTTPYEYKKATTKAKNKYSGTTESRWTKDQRGYYKTTKTPGQTAVSGSGRGGGGGGGGGGSSTPATPAQTFSPIQADVYGPIRDQLDGIMNEYKNIKANYVPGQFSYDPMEDRAIFDQKANDRANSEVASLVESMAGQRVANANTYDAALRNIELQKAGQFRDIGTRENLDIGRMANMSANMGLGSGFGAMANTYGITNDYAGKYADAASQATANAQDANMSRANAEAEMNAKIGAARAGRVARAGELGDTLYNTAFDQYQTGRNQAFGEFDSNEGRARQADQDRLSTIYSNLAGRENVLGAQQGMAQDVRNTLMSDYWNNRNFNYTAGQDKLGYGLAKGAQDIGVNQYNTTRYDTGLYTLINEYTSAMANGVDATAIKGLIKSKYGLNL
jgi:hypothetical protein